MRAGDVVVLLQECSAAGAAVWVAGGWAVDAIVGHQTREHGDLDLAADAADLPVLLRILRRGGFVVTVDQGPSRLEFTAPDGRVVDIHPVTFGADGAGVQPGIGSGSFRYAVDGFTRGTIDGVDVPCLSVEQQLQFRRGYDRRPVDDHDIGLLTAASGP